MTVTAEAATSETGLALLIHREAFWLRAACAVLAHAVHRSNSFEHWLLSLSCVIDIF
jgi:hypothetical protein